MAINNQVNIVVQAIDKATAPLKKMESSFSGLKSSVEWMAWPIKAAWVALVWIWGFWLKIAGDFEQTRISFETMLWDADKAKKLLWELSDFAAKTPFEFPEIAQAWKSLLAFWFEAEQIQTNLTRLWDIASWLNIPFTELSDIYGKIRVQWRLYQEDINQLTWRWIPIIWELAKQFWVTESEVKKLVETWKVWFPEIEQAFIDLTSEWSKFGWMMEKQSQSLNWVLSTLKDNLKMTLMEIMWINKEWEIAAWSLMELSKQSVTSMTTYMENNKSEIQENAEALIKVLWFVAKVIIWIWKIIYWIWEDIWSALASITIFGWKVKKFFEDLNPQAKQWWINLVKMMSQWILIWWKDLIGNAVKEVATTISDYLWFHSPTKKWPASDSDKWMPNFIWMMVEWLNKWKSSFSKATLELSSVLVQEFGKWWNLEQIQEVLDDLESKFRDVFSWLSNEISTWKSNISWLKNEIEALNKQLENNKKSINEIEAWKSQSIAQRVVDLEKQLENKDLDSIEKRKLKEELNFASQNTSLEEIQALKDYQALSETEKIIYNADLKKTKLLEEQELINTQLTAKQAALQTEVDAVQALYEQKRTFENEFHSLFMINAEERNLKIKEAISLMQQLNETREKASEYVSWQRAVWWTVASWKTYLVWERWPELFTPSTTGKITSNNQLWSWWGVNISINMWWITVKNEADENRLIEKIKRELTNSLQMQKFGIS